MLQACDLVLAHLTDDQHQRVFFAGIGHVAYDSVTRKSEAKAERFNVLLNGAQSDELSEDFHDARFAPEKAQGLAGSPSFPMETYTIPCADGMSSHLHWPAA